MCAVLQSLGPVTRISVFCMIYLVTTNAAHLSFMRVIVVNIGSNHYYYGSIIYLLLIILN